MIDSDDLVCLSDDDTSEIIHTKPKENRILKKLLKRNGLDFTEKNKVSTELEIIDLDDGDDLQQDINLDNDVIILTDTENSQKIKNCGDSKDDNIIELADTKTSQNISHDEIFKKNRLLAQFVEKCLDLENSEGMLRVIDRTLLRVYQESDKNYQKSQEFQKVLNKTMSLLETEPQKKFSHLKNVCETLKFHKAKKRATLITLKTNLKENTPKRKMNIDDRTVKKPKLNEVIELDDDDKPILNKNEPIIDLDDYEKENLISSISSEENSQNKFLTPQVEVYLDPTNVSAVGNEDSFINEDFKEVPVTYSTDIRLQIEAIEEQIARLKKQIQALDEQEVDLDSNYSTYIQSESLKSKIVEFYKKLCVLTGQESVKFRKVRLQVYKGHPPGPVRRLEEFINSNIGSDGDPPFPDICDVIKCVLEANEEDNLGWGKSQVMREASSLFTQCGRAMQKRRQHREWRDLIAKVKIEAIDDDPADENPELLAKLEENRRLAMKKETDLLERYSMMEKMHVPAFKVMNPQNRKNHLASSSKLINLENTEDLEKMDSEFQSENIENEDAACGEEKSTLETNKQMNEGVENENVGVENEKLHFNETDIVPAKLLNSNYKEINLEKVNDTVNFQNQDIDADKTNNNFTNEDKNKDTKSNTEKATKDTSQPNCENNKEVNTQIDTRPVKIKTEVVDIAAMLEELGDNFSSNVIDIEDPFLVIEISSDSSDDEV